MIQKRIIMYLRFLRSMLRVNHGLLRGMWRLTKLPQPAITVFGGTRLTQESRYAKIISEITKKLAHEGFSIITGGGPGIMEAANLGAWQHMQYHGEGKREIDRRMISIGIGVSKLDQGKNEYLQEYLSLPYFFTRKWLLVRYAAGFIVGPGGFGTLDELSEVITLIQTHHMPQTPVVLIGTQYWKPLLDWIESRALKEGFLTPDDAKLISITDDAHEAYSIIKRRCTNPEICGITAQSEEK